MKLEMRAALRENLETPPPNEAQTIFKKLAFVIIQRQERWML